MLTIEIALMNSRTLQQQINNTKTDQRNKMTTQKNCKIQEKIGIEGVKDRERERGRYKLSKQRKKN